MSASEVEASLHRGEESCLVVSDLNVQFGELRVLENINLTVAKGERRGVIGPNGAGKTTFFNALAGIVKPTSGTIKYFDKDVSRTRAFKRAGMGIARTFQRTKLFPGLTVMDNLVLSLQASSPVRFQPFRSREHYSYMRETVLEHLAQFDLASRANHEITSMGHGEQRQIEILMAMVQSPKLLLLDEPMAGLAGADSHIVTEMLAACDESITIVMIEHDMDVVFEVSEKLMVLHAGHVVADGTVDEVRENPMVHEVYLGGKV